MDERRMKESVKDAIIFEGIYLDSQGREKPIYKLQKTWRYFQKICT